MAAEDPAARLTYRLMREDEMEAAARLFDLAGWGPVPPQMLHSWFFGGSLGPVVVVVAADEHDEPKAMMTFSPYQVQLFDRVGTAYRGRATILAPEIRRSARGVQGAVDELDPVTRMNDAAKQYVDERGWEFHFALPSARMLTRGKADDAPERPERERTGIHSEVSFGAFKINVEETEPGPVTLDVQPKREPYGDEYDALWERARKGLGIECALLRDTTGLNHARGSQLRLECRHPSSGELVGYVLLHERLEARIQDILAVDEDAMHQVAGSAFNWLRAHYSEIPTKFVSTLVHPTYADALREVGGYEVEWEFTFILNTHHPEPRPELEAARWYVTTGD